MKACQNQTSTKSADNILDQIKTIQDKLSSITLDTQESSLQLSQEITSPPSAILDQLALTLTRTINTNHKNGIIKALLLNDETHVITCSTDSSIQIYDLKSGLALGTLMGHNKVVRDIIMLTSGLLASCSDDQTIRIWNLDQMICKNVLKDHSAQVYRLLELSNNKLISTSRDASMKVWDLQSDDVKCLRTISNADGDLVFACISINNEDIAYGSRKDISILHFETGTVKKILSGHTDTVRDLLILSDKNTLISGSQDSTIRIWNIDLAECKLVLSGHTDIISKLHFFSPEVLMSASFDRTVRFWDLKTGKCLKVLKGDRNGVCFITTMCNGSLLSVGTEDVVKIWSLNQR